MKDSNPILSRLLAMICAQHSREEILPNKDASIAAPETVEQKLGMRWGLLAGKIAVPEDIDATNPDIEALFNGDIR
jgi:hypothetical protein